MLKKQLYLIQSLVTRKYFLVLDLLILKAWDQAWLEKAKWVQEHQVNNQ